MIVFWNLVPSALTLLEWCSPCEAIYTSEEIRYAWRNLSLFVCFMVKTASLSVIRHNIVRAEHKEYSSHRTLGHGAAQISVPAGCVLWCVPHSLWRSALSQHVPEIFKDFQAQGRLTLLRWLANVSSPSCWYVFMVCLLSSLFIRTYVLYANAHTQFAWWFLTFFPPWSIV